jgi:hypothetical protein
MSEQRPPEVEAAFKELGLPLETPAEDLRRAYLRVVKVRKPETDPEGFRKAREAFDLLSGWFQFLANRAAQASEAIPPAEAANAEQVEAPPAVPVAEALLRPWDSLRPLLEARDARGARAKIRELLAADVAPPTLMPVFFLLLDLQRAEPGAEGRATLREFIAFVQRARAELAFAQNHELWLLVKEVATLPDQTPPEIERAIVEGIVAGSLDPTFKEIEAFTRANPEVSDGLILPLSSNSPLLHQLLTPVLNIELIKRRDGGVVSEESSARFVEVPPSTGRGWTSGMPVGLIVVLLLTVGKFLAREASEPSSPQPSPSYNYNDPSGWQPKPKPAANDPFTVPASLTPSPLSALDELCRLSPDDCARAKAARLKLVQGDCAGARFEYFALVRSPNINGGVVVARAIRETIKSLEPGLGPCHLP